MPASPVRYGVPNPTDPVIHELPPFRYEGGLVGVRLELRRADDGTWRGRLLFGEAGDTEVAPATAEIFYAHSEPELWECVHDLREHHLRDLYRSVSG
ncbi:MAG: hypothetical protein PVH40_03760 [Gemmatimonadales bacterium]|jgi:hypothetical protein